MPLTLIAFSFNGSAVDVICIGNTTVREELMKNTARI